MLAVEWRVDGEEDGGEGDEVDDGVEDGDDEAHGDGGEGVDVVRDALVGIVDLVLCFQHVIAVFYGSRSYTLQFNFSNQIEKSPFVRLIHV